MGMWDRGSISYLVAAAVFPREAHRLMAAASHIPCPLRAPAVTSRAGTYFIEARMSLTRTTIDRAFAARQLRGGVTRFPVSGSICRRADEIVAVGISSVRSDVDGYRTVPFPLSAVCLRQGIYSPISEERIRRRPCEYTLVLGGFPDSPVDFASAGPDERILGRSRRMIAQGFTAGLRCGITDLPIGSADGIIFVGHVVERILPTREVETRTIAVSQAGIDALLADPDVMLAAEDRAVDVEFSIGLPISARASCPSSIKPDCGC